MLRGGEQVQSKEPENEIMLRLSPLGMTVGRASAVKSVNLEECLCLNSCLPLRLQTGGFLRLTAPVLKLQCILVCGLCTPK